MYGNPNKTIIKVPKKIRVAKTKLRYKYALIPYISRIFRTKKKILEENVKHLKKLQYNILIYLNRKKWHFLRAC